MMSRNHRLPVAVAIVAAGLTTLSPSNEAFAKQDLSVERTVIVNAAPATVWKLVGDFNHLDVWHPVVVGSDRNGDVRVLTLGNGAHITERLVSTNAASYTYAIEEGPLPVDNYVSTLAVEAADGGKTLVRWQSHFEAKGASDEEAEAAIAGVYEAGLSQIAKNFE